MSNPYAQLLVDRLTGREDVFAVQQADGSYRPVHRPFTVAIAQSHIDGNQTVGQYLLRSDSTCRFGVLDFDGPNYPSLDSLHLAVTVCSQILRHMGLPHLLENSGSKGFHLWVLLEEPTDAALIQQFLATLHAQLEAEIGFTCPVEVFPKQTRITPDRPLGNLIKLPWGMHRKSGRRALFVDTDLRYLTPVDAQRSALQSCRALSVAELNEFLGEFPAPAEGSTPSRTVNLTDRKSSSFGISATPLPCTSRLFLLPVRESQDGGRNTRVFDLTVRCFREGVPEKLARDRIRTYNKALCEPPLSDRELLRIHKQVYEKGYGSLHCEELKAVCAGPECAIYRSTHNLPPPEVAALDEEEPQTAITDLVKIETEPPTWRLRVDGVDVELIGDELLRWNTFRAQVFSTLNVIFNLPRRPKQSAQLAWEEKLAPILASCQVEKVPEEASETGRLRDVIREWAKVNAKRQAVPEDLIETRFPVCLHAYPGVVLFRTESLQTFLERRRIGQFSRREIWLALKDLEAVNTLLRVESKVVRCWKLPMEFDAEESKAEAL